MAKERLVAVVDDSVAPLLRAAGFTRKGLCWLRIRSCLIDCVEFQLHSDRVSYSVNLGLHMDFLPTPSGLGMVELASFTQADCEIKQRLTPQGEADWWWLLDNPAHAAEMQACLKVRGLSFFEKYRDLPGPFESITPDNIDSEYALALFGTTTKTRRILLLARIYEYVKDAKNAVLWSKIGLHNIGGSVSLKKAFMDIIQRAGR